MRRLDDGPAALAVRLLLAVALLVAGALSAVAAVAVHGLWWGLALASVALPVAVLVLPRGWATRLPFAAGFAAAVARLAVPRPEGDFLVAADPSGYALLLLTLLVVLLAVVTLPRPAGRARPTPERPPGRTGTDT